MPVLLGPVLGVALMDETYWSKYERFRAAVLARDAVSYDDMMIAVGIVDQARRDMEKIMEFSDAEMQDGDAARDVAAAFLGTTRTP